MSQERDEEFQVALNEYSKMPLGELEKSLASASFVKRAFGFFGVLVLLGILMWPNLFFILAGLGSVYYLAQLSVTADQVIAALKQNIARYEGKASR